MRNERFTLRERSESDGPDPVDALIDSAARQMMAGEPSASLRSSVRDRVAHRRPVRSLVPAWGLAAGVAMAALIVGRALLTDPVAPTLSGPSGNNDDVRTTIERAANPLLQPPVAESNTRLTRRLADDVAVPQEEESLIPPIAIEPVEPVQIAVGNPIAVESSGVMPIEIEPLQLEPLRGIE